MTSSGSGPRNLPNLKPAKCLTWEICQILCPPIFPAIRYIEHLRAHKFALKCTTIGGHGVSTGCDVTDTPLTDCSKTIVTITVCGM